MPQHPKLTVGWALDRLESAIKNLGDGPAERRVRDQFHQLLLALELDRLPTDLQTLKAMFLEEEDFSLRN